MASSLQDPNAIAPSTTNITVGTSAVALKSSTSLAVRFTISNPNASNAIYLGDSNVASNRWTAKIAAGTSVTLDIAKPTQNQSSQYDLNRFYVVATSATQVATLSLFIRGASGGSF
jgi:hypothetical protein